MAKNEIIEFNLLGMKVKCINPTRKTIVIIGMLLAFFLALFIINKTSPNFRYRLDESFQIDCFSTCV